MAREKALPIPPGSERRPEQRHGAPGAKRTQGLLHCVCAEHAQPGNQRGPSPAHATCTRRHCLRAILYARGKYAAAIGRVVRSGNGSGRHAHASGPGVADAARAQRPADPRHLIDRTPSKNRAAGKPAAAGRCSGKARRAGCGGVGSHPLNRGRIRRPPVHRSEAFPVRIVAARCSPSG